MNKVIKIIASKAPRTFGGNTSVIALLVVIFGLAAFGGAVLQLKIMDWRCEKAQKSEPL